MPTPISTTPGSTEQSADLSGETPVQARPVSREFLSALTDAGARPSLVSALESEIAASEPKPNR
jgi:hypothetical protein